MAQTTLQIEGMRCGNCVNTVTSTLEGLPGIERAKVNLESGTAVVEYDPQQTPAEDMASAVTTAGFATQVSAEPVACPVPETHELSGSYSPPTKPDEAAERILLNVDGMHCASCVGRVEGALNSVEGVQTAQVNLATEQANVYFSGEAVNSEKLIAAIRSAGYEAQVARSEGSGEELTERNAREAARWQRRLIVGAGLLVVIIAVHFLLHAAAWSPWLSLAVATVMQGYVGWPYYVGALQRARHASTNMDTLVALGTGAAYLSGVASVIAGESTMYFMDAGMILVFITFGKTLELRAKGRASSAIRKLLDLSPKEATLLVDGREVQTPVDDVEVGQILVIKPGDRVPLDAEVQSGQSQLDESWLSGESLPVDKEPGDQLLAGSINGGGALRAVVNRPAGRTSLDEVIDLVRRAQESKADVQRLADRVVTYFVPVILGIAAVTLLAWGLSASDWSSGLSAMIAVLVVACPCALGLATPTAVLVGSGRGAEAGILIKEAHALEAAGSVHTMVLDKTGTVTMGRPSVVAIHAVEGHTEDELLSVAAAAERLSRHPLAQCIVDAVDEKQVAEIEASDLQVVAGAGVRAKTGDTTVLVGNESLMSEAGISVESLQDEISQRRDQGQSPLLVAHDGQLLGMIVVADEVAPHSREAIQRLKDLGLEVMIVTGDHRTTAESIAQKVGVDRVEAEVLPADKAKIVSKLRSEGKTVAMVGDGINDAPALAEADVGVAIGAGADVAIEAADIVLVADDLRAAAKAIVLSRATLRTIRQNLVWAFIYNMVLVPVAAGVFVAVPGVGFRLPPVAAAAAMAASSVSVVANSLRLRAKKLD